MSNEKGSLQIKLTGFLGQASAMKLALTNIGNFEELKAESVIHNETFLVDNISFLNSRKFVLELAVYDKSLTLIERFFAKLNFIENRMSVTLTPISGQWIFAEKVDFELKGKKTIAFDSMMIAPVSDAGCSFTHSFHLKNSGTGVETEKGALFYELMNNKNTILDYKEIDILKGNMISRMFNPSNNPPENILIVNPNYSDADSIKGHLINEKTAGNVFDKDPYAIRVINGSTVETTFHFVTGERLKKVSESKGDSKDFRRDIAELRETLNKEDTNVQLNKDGSIKLNNTRVLTFIKNCTNCYKVYPVKTAEVIYSIEDYNLIIKKVNAVKTI